MGKRGGRVSTTPGSGDLHEFCIHGWQCILASELALRSPSSCVSSDVCGKLCRCRRLGLSLPSSTRPIFFFIMRRRAFEGCDCFVLDRCDAVALLLLGWGWFGR